MSMDTLAAAQERQSEILRFAEEIFAQKPTWATFYRAVLGVNGAVRNAFPTRSQMNEFEQSDAFREIQRMLTQLRKEVPYEETDEEPTRVITVRIPKSLHAGLREEAFERKTSINQLCISKLINFIEDELIPDERPKPKMK